MEKTYYTLKQKRVTNPTGLHGIDWGTGKISLELWESRADLERYQRDDTWRDAEIVEVKLSY